METLSTLIDTHQVDVHPHLDRDDPIPVLSGPQAQGDLIVLPAGTARPSPTGTARPVPAAGVPVLRGEAMGNTHLLLADGNVTWAPCDTTQDLGVVDVADGATAWLAHPEHGYTGIAPGRYLIRRQREQADEIRVVAD